MLICKPALRPLIALAVVMTWSSPCAFRQPGGSGLAPPDSSSVAATKTGDGQYQARISGDLTLHGVTRPLTIAAHLEFGDKTFQATGAFALKQSSFEIKPVSVAGGTIKVKDELKFTFEIVAHP